MTILLYILFAEERINLTEIPLPPIEPPPTPEKGGCNKMFMAIGVIAIIVISGVVITAIMGNGGNGDDTTTTTTASTTTTTTTTTTTSGDLYSTRVVADYQNQDIDLASYYRAEFSVSSSECQTSWEPDLHFDINVESTGSDTNVTVGIFYAVYDTDMATVDSLSWEDLETYRLYGGPAYGDTIPNPVDDFINLYNYAHDYTWVFWFEADYKTSVWSVDITLTLRYNWFPA
ncbi:MAG: hypothetical protein ACFE7R_06575 [Candidatus Hodarchaeota archaeon]